MANKLEVTVTITRNGGKPKVYQLNTTMESKAGTWAIFQAPAECVDIAPFGKLYVKPNGKAKPKNGK